jgi:hemerythrin
MAWNEEVSVGVQKWDDDHNGLIAFMNQMHEAIAMGQTRQAINAIVDRLVESVKAHCAREEAFFVQSGFAGAPAHHFEHDQMLRTALEWQAHFNSGSSPAMTMDVLSRFKSWLDNHIQGADMQYGPHLNSKGIHYGRDGICLGVRAFHGVFVCRRLRLSGVRGRRAYTFSRTPS